MRKEILKLKKEIGEEFLLKIDTYKKQNNLSYSQIAEIAGINKFYFANLRNKIKEKGKVPTNKILKKFEECGIL